MTDLSTLDLSTLDLFTPEENARHATFNALPLWQQRLVNEVKLAEENRIDAIRKLAEMRLKDVKAIFHDGPWSDQDEERLESYKAARDRAASTAFEARTAALDAGVPACLLNELAA